MVFGSVLWWKGPTSTDLMSLNVSEQESLLMLKGRRLL
jgi:hypothetical protein